MADIAAVVIQTLQWVGAPVRRQFQYLCCFTRNITSLRNEANQLEGATQDLLGKVDRATNDLRDISSGVQIWLQNSNDIENETRGILDEVSNVESGCLKLGARFFLSRRAKKTADRVKELRGRSNFQADDISRPRPPAATEAVPLERTCEFESRKKIEEDIMATLAGEYANTVGICGMGGLGKTTMAKRIMNRALEEHVFDEVVMVVVSRPIDELKIQLEIARSLGLNIENEGLQGRAQKLHTRLSGPKRTLIILDDVWETLELKDLGIPHDYKGCTILLTSRNRDVLSAMNVQKDFGMKVLSEEDSWNMFRERVGTCVDNTELNSLARKVVNECKGLPLALTTVGAALKGVVDVNAWKNAVGRLEKGDPDIQGYSAKVYNPLKLSYDALEPKFQDVFLLCCVYPEDADIPLEQLTSFCMGLRIATGNVEEARNTICARTNVLKNRSLLLDSEKGDEYVRMHDVVRDVCIFIAKQKGYIGDNDLTSSLQRYKLHSGFELLQIRNSYEEINFDGITDLHVFSIETYWQLTSLPFTQMLRNLYTLVLNWCPRVDTLSVVGELVNLEILICHDCHSIKELPPEIKGLNRLKVLDLTRCRNLKRIGRGIISSLVGLDELKMLGSFIKWEAEDNAGLGELEALTKLRCLEIEIEDPALAAEDICLSSEIDRFTIRFFGRSTWTSNFDGYLSKRKLRLNWKGATCLGHWIEMQLLKDIECLLLVGNGANNVDLTKLEKKIRYLELGRCESMKNVVTSSMDDGGGATVFPSLDHLILFELPELEEICDDRISSNSFQNLKILKLDHLPALKQLWKSSQNDFGKGFLPQLEVLQIEFCEMMEAVFLWKGEEGNENNSCHPITIRFPKLKELGLRYLPNLISFCKGIEGIEFPLMRKIKISECGKMKGMVWNEKISGSIHDLFCPQQVLFGCLKKLDTDRNPFSELEELEIFACDGILSLFTSSMAGNLVNLQRLEIICCEEMLEVIKDDEEKCMSGGQSALLFPKLQTIQLWNLCNLKSFCESKEIESIQFPVLRSVKIKGCEKMKGMVANGLTSNDNNSGGSYNNAHPNIFCESQLVSFGCVKELEIDWNPFTIDVSLFNGLEKLTIYKCAGSLSLFTSSIAGNLLHLKVLSIGDCDDSLNFLEVDAWLQKSKDIQIETQGILDDVSKCAGSRSLFSSSMAGNLVNLKELRILGCEEMVEVIKDDEEKGMSGGGQRALLFPKLDTLELRSLPKLVSFCELKCDVEFPSLRVVVTRNCRNMKNFTLGSLAAPNLESFVTDLNNYLLLLQVPFISLKKLLVFENEKPLNCYQIHGSVFDRLEELDIRWYKGSMSLFSSSITGNLVNLTTLTIRDCRKMVKVIEEKEEEKEKVVSGAQRTTILFPKLHKIELWHLHKLVRFCEWKCDVELPSLRELRILYCHNMKSFTLGPLNTPKLESVEINGKLDVGGVKDLNGLVQQRYLSREEDEEKKKKNGQKIMEEQN